MAKVYNTGDIDLIRKLIKDNYEQFESSMSMSEFNKELSLHISDLESFGEDTEMSTKAVLADFDYYRREI